MTLGDLTKQLIAKFNQDNSAHTKVLAGSILLGMVTCGLSFCYYRPNCGNNDNNSSEACCFTWPDKIPHDQKIQLSTLKSILKGNIAILETKIARKRLDPEQAIRLEAEYILLLLISARDRGELSAFKSRENFINQLRLFLRNCQEVRAETIRHYESCG